MKLPESDQSSAGPNLTPVIDVVFLLLIFFLVATRFDQEEKEIDTRLPQVVKARPMSTGHEQIIVNISSKGEYKVAGHEYTAEQLAEMLKQQSNKNRDMQTVQIRCDERTDFKYPARVMGICERVKIKHMCAVEQVR